MDFLYFLKKNQQTTSDSTTTLSSDRKNEIIEAVIAQMGQMAPSFHFAAGSVFDIVRQNHNIFTEIVRSRNAFSLKSFLVNAYISFCSDPDSAGVISTDIIQINNDDTEPRRWNVDIFDLSYDCMAALCYMPIQDSSFDARIIGIIISQHEDGYYYCMLRKGENTLSDVMRNNPLMGIRKVGDVRGRGFELMDSFLDCMQKDFLKEAPEPVRQELDSYLTSPESNKQENSSRNDSKSENICSGCISVLPTDTKQCPVCGLVISS